MKILSVCLIIITLFVTMTIQYNYQAYPNKYRRQFNNEYNPYYNKYDNNKGKNYDDTTTTTTNNNDNNNNNDNYNYGYNRKPGNNYPYKMYPNKKPNKIPLTRKYIMEGEAKHIHQKHGEKHIKAVGELFGFTDTYQGSDYELTTTFHKGSISTKSGKPKYFSTYDTEGLMKHYQNTHGRAKFNLNAKSHGHEKYKDQKEMKATVTFENNDNTIDDESNYSPTSHPYGKLEGY